jgi:hypothetical protein
MNEVLQFLAGKFDACVTGGRSTSHSKQTQISINDGETVRPIIRIGLLQ